MLKTPTCNNLRFINFILIHCIQSHAAEQSVYVKIVYQTSFRYTLDMNTKISRFLGIPLFVLLILFFSTCILYFPLIINHDLLLARNNDLSEVFWPFFYFIKINILQNHQLPMWNNLIFAGTPLLPDPQFSLFYPFNLLFVIFPTDLGFFIYLTLHTFIGAVGIYLISKNVLNYGENPSIFTSLLYLFTPKVAFYLTSGHSGLVATTAWVPILLYATLMLAKNPQIKWTILYAVSLAAIFYTHTIIFLLASIASILVFALSYLFFKYSIQSIYKLFLGVLLTFGLIAVALLPQLEWMPQTTRLLLLETREVHPKWDSIKELIQLSIFPYDQTSFDSEKWISFGFVPVILAIVGFMYVRRQLQYLLLLTLIICGVIIANNASPFHRFLIQQDYFVLMRVATRIWFIPALIIFFLAGFGFKQLLQKTHLRYLVIFLAVVSLFEFIAVDWLQLSKPIASNNTPTQIYEYLKQDPEHFRIFCTNRCLSQKQAAIYNLELIDGYNTLQQTNYYQQSWQLMGGYWNYYTLSIPPIGSYTFEQHQPDPISLGNFNTKYVVSPYKLTNPNFVLEKTFGNYYIYINNLYQSRAYFIDSASVKHTSKITKYTPNIIRIDTKNAPSNKLILSEVYNSGWKAYLNGEKQVLVQETPDRLRQVDIENDTKFVEFKYQPKSFIYGLTISILAIFIIIFILIKSKR